MWGLKQKICPKTGDVPTAMKDTNGNLITNKNSLKNLYKETYLERLSHKPARPEWQEVQNLKETLFQLRIRKSTEIKSKDWNIAKLKML